ncbi:MAG: hypothetical protein DKT66_23310 [Candidatus Melainabacteria bacterium]|nr:MAG: hypothetical protein DKT66_23310 [Candidatus Melainabacteria bacterium]
MRGSLTLILEKELIDMTAHFKRSLPLLLTVLCAFSLASAAAQGPKFEFEATYRVESELGSGSLQQASDGKGRMLHENTSPAGKKSITILDFKNKTLTQLVERDKMAFRSKMDDGSSILVYDDNYAKAKEAKSLGSKIIDGHPCHGWKSSRGALYKEIWIGDDTRYLVHSESRRGAHTTKMFLKKWSNKLENRKRIDVPDGYHLTSVK